MTNLIRRVARRIRLATTDGAIDLASVMVGVIVLGIISAVILATVFSVIPWSQDRAAEMDLDSVNTAESVFKAQGPDVKYSGLDGLVAAKLLPASSSRIRVATDATGSCWVATAASASGKMFVASSSQKTVKELAAGETTDCADLSYGGAAAPSHLVMNAAELSGALANSADGTVISVGANITSVIDDWNAAGDGPNNPLMEVGAGRHVTLNLNGYQVSVKAQVGGWAGIAVPGGSGITISDSSASKTGKLTAQGGGGAAGIGAPFSYGMDDGAPTTIGAITIDGTTVDATGQMDSSGIGGGPNELTAEEPIRIINGAHVTATGSGYAPGIGGGRFTPSPAIVISDSTVTATAGDENAAAGIGGGGDGIGLAMESINITNSTVIAQGASGIGAAIGTADISTVTISNSHITAKATATTNAAIGGGAATNAGHITFGAGSVVIATVAGSGAGAPDLVGNGAGASGITVTYAPGVTVNGVVQ